MGNQSDTQVSVVILLGVAIEISASCIRGVIFASESGDMSFPILLSDRFGEIDVLASLVTVEEQEAMEVKPASVFAMLTSNDESHVMGK